MPRGVKTDIRSAASFPKKMLPLIHHVNDESVMGQRPIWSFTLLDHEPQPKWSWAFKGQDFAKLAVFLKEMEVLTWRDIRSQNYNTSSTGHKKHHSMDVSVLCTEAKKRLAELELDDIDQIFRFRLGGKLRLWGVIVPDTAVFCPIWWDNEHEVYPLDN